MPASFNQPLPPAVYLTTAIDYVNAPPHLGHAYEKIATDALARFYRLIAVPTYFLTGTDEHGNKIEKNALSQNLSPQAFTDQLSQHFKAAWALCNLSYDRFIRTTESAHYAVVKQVWQTLEAKGDLYKAPYTGKYCSGCEAFLTDKDLDENGQCRIHHTTPDLVEEENWFFKLSHYKEALKTHILANPFFIQPAFRQQEVLNMVDDLQDISVSRSKRSVTWGVPVPNDDSQVIYVWIDALSNYLTGLNFSQSNNALYQQFWHQGDVIHIIGKDILRFHAIYWPAMLMGLGLPLPKTIFAHGFITLNEEKISKSLGNVVAPVDLVTHYELPNADAIRYYLLTCTQFGNDGNFTTEEFKLKVNADLANNLGNLLNRTLSMLAKYNDGKIPSLTLEEVTGNYPVLAPLVEQALFFEQWQQAFLQFDFQQVAALALTKVDLANKLINDLQPWTLFKENNTHQLNALLLALLESVRLVALALYPITPQLSEGICSQLGLASLQANASLKQLLRDTVLQPNQSTNPQGPLLPRLESELVGSGVKK
jgi:methionyl-tRNA synthetase